MIVCQGCAGDGQGPGESLRLEPVLKLMLCRECTDTAIDHLKLTQRFLIHYQTPFGARFGVQVHPNLKLARRDRDLFAADGLAPRIVKLTVDGGQPVAEWVN